MHRAAQALVGEHDFTSFRAAACQSLSAHRCIHRISVLRFESFVVLDVTANAFLLHMVRNLAGALARVGHREQEESWIGRVLMQRDRTLVGPTAPPEGLYLVDVSYPGHDLPYGSPAPLLRACGGLDRF
jgi:tRNA pseudouridine38-40 synthase